MKYEKTLKSTLRGIGAFVPALLTYFASGSPARADILFLDSFKNAQYQQTGNGNTVSLTGYFFSADLNTAVPNSYTSASVAFPGAGSPLALSEFGTTDYHAQSSLYATKAAIDAAYPFGTYTFTGVNGGATNTAGFNYSSDDYSSTVPYLTGTQFSSLQGFNSANAFIFSIVPFIAGSNAGAAFTFFTIVDNTTGMPVFSATFLSPSSTSVTLPGHTLTPGDSYTYDIDYSTRDFLPSPGAANNAQIGFDVRTLGNFTTAPAVALTPEPSTALLAALALIAIPAFRRKLRSR